MVAGRPAAARVPLRQRSGQSCRVKAVVIHRMVAEQRREIGAREEWSHPLRAFADRALRRCE
jgi:hypothetical protein